MLNLKNVQKKFFYFLTRTEELIYNIFLAIDKISLDISKV